MPTFSFDATSGVSGNVFKYKISFIETVANVDRTQPTGELDSFMGLTVNLKTYSQY